VIVEAFGDTVRLKVRAAVLLALSLTVTLKLNALATAGDPLKTPPVDKFKPTGKLPELEVLNFRTPCS
jgi:hypothetical protein